MAGAGHSFHLEPPGHDLTADVLGFFDSHLRRDATDIARGSTGVGGDGEERVEELIVQHGMEYLEGVRQHRTCSACGCTTC